MQLSNNELLALIKLRIILVRGHPHFPEFLSWIRDRLVMHYGDDPMVDFIQALERYSSDLKEIQRLLD